MKLTQQIFGEVLNQPVGVQYEGTKGELYNLIGDPWQHRNLWNDPVCPTRRADLATDLYDTLDPLPVRPMEYGRRPDVRRHVG